jgi:UDP-2-acetamido-3-amino-2,3-dideoxy-glucuronate N-acetyltransferase
MKKIDPSAKVYSKFIGENTVIWQYVVILKGARIGENCNINCHTFIENDVEVGDNVTIKSGVYLWDGIKIHNNAFIGPNVTFTNDIFPRSKSFPEHFQKTIIREGASLGANATILGGISIGEYSLVGAGSVVTKSVPDNALVVGNPARIVGWVDNNGKKMELENGYYLNEKGEKFEVIDNTLTLCK